MENFIRITDDVPAPRERVIPKGPTKNLGDLSGKSLKIE